MKVALVRNGVVVIATTADQSYVDAVTPDWDAVLTFEDGHPVSADWIVIDGTAAPAPSVTQVPQSVTMRQGREAIIRAGLDEAVDAAIDAIVDPIARKVARNYWTMSNNFERDNPLISQLGAQAGLTEGQIDQLFIVADTL